MMHAILVFVLASPFCMFVVGVVVGLFWGGFIAGYRLDQQRRRDASFFDGWR